MQMNHEQDSFDDNELTEMAMEIIQDSMKLSSAVDFTYLLMQDGHSNVSISTLTSNEHLLKRPCIIDRTPLEPNDSLNRAFPDLPDNKSLHHRTRTTSNDRCRPDMITLNSSHIPVYDSAGIGSCTSVISPRPRTHTRTVSSSPIPDFSAPPPTKPFKSKRNTIANQVSRNTNRHLRVRSAPALCKTTGLRIISASSGLSLIFE
eukprot:437844_1